MCGGFMKNASVEISDKLARLLSRQTDFFKSLSHTPEEIMEYEQSRDRIRELFAKLEKSRAA
jgi:hypothetical protein